MIPGHGLVAVYETPNGPFYLKEYPVRPPADNEVLVQIQMSTICRSDIHSYEGKRPNPCPGVLGHEIVGKVIALGEHITVDMRGTPLTVGDRITWSEYFVEPGHYIADVLDMPQKSPVLEKYGHICADHAPHHHGGFAQYCYVLNKSWILKIPDVLSDEEATPINCGVATMLAVIEVCGEPQAINDGLKCLRVGGRYVIAGLVSPNAHVLIDGNLILKKMLTLRGVHNYHPRHLVQALDFVTTQRNRFPFKSLVDAKYSLSQVRQAMQDASSRRSLRAAIVPFITENQ